MNRITSPLRGASAALITLGLVAVWVSPSHAADEPHGHWVVKHSKEVVSVDPIVVDGSAGTVLYATFDPNDPPAHVHTVSIDESPVVTVPGGLAPQYTQTSLNPVTHRLYVSQFGSAKVSVIDTTTGTQVHEFEKEKWMPWSAAVDTSRNLVYVVDGNDKDWNPSGSITVIDGATDKVVTEVSAPDDLAFPAVSEKHRKLYVPTEGEEQGTILVFDTETNALSGSIETSAAAVPLMAIVDDTLDRLFVLQVDSATNEGSILVVDTKTDQVVHEPIALDAHHSVGDASMAYDPAARQLYVAEFTSDGLSNKLVTIDATTHTVIARDEIPNRHSDDVTAAAAVPFSPLQIGIDPATSTLFLTTTDDRILAFGWEEPAPAPAPEHKKPTHLAETGSFVDPAVVALAAMLLIGGALVVASRRPGRARE